MYDCVMLTEPEPLDREEQSLYDNPQIVLLLAGAGEMVLQCNEENA